MAARLSEILKVLDAHYPPAWAAAGDRVGLEAGHPDQPVDAALVALEVTPAVIAEARQTKAQLLLTHHPLLYRPPDTLREDQTAGRLAADLIRANLALFSCHTNLDAAPQGLNDYLARRLALTRVEVLSPTYREPHYKLVVFLPAGYEDQVRQALGDAGLGQIGRYSHCTFASRGQGAFKPLPGAQPFLGEVGEVARVEESRLEILAPESRLAQGLQYLKQVHPYEEVAFDVYPVQQSGAPLGFGRIGVWDNPRPFSQVAALVKEIFSVPQVRVWGRPPAQVARLAVLGGSGGDLIDEARRQGAQVYITGEVRHHQAPVDLEDLAVLEVGHFASEVVFMAPWAEQLQGHFQAAGLDLEVQAARSQTCPVAFC